MNIFLSYPSARRDTAVRLKLALEAEQHEVFFDRDDLGAGEAYHQAIRDAMAASDAMVFLVAPESVAPGSYTLAELAMAEARWRRPAGHVLPVVVAPTPRATIPAYLLAVTLLEPQGDLVAETLGRVAAMAARHRTRPWRWVVTGTLLVVLAGAAVWALREQQARQQAVAQRAAQQVAQQAAQVEAVARAARLCSQGGYADGFGQLSRLAAAPTPSPGAQTALEDCAMSWLREPRAARAERTFAQFAAPLRQVLSAALVAGASGARAADLRAHLGWADALNWHDERNPAIDPSQHYRQALQDDPGNVYAHALWGHWLLKRPPLQLAPAQQHFEAAVGSGRDLPFVRKLQLGIAVDSESLAPYAYQVLNQMRQRGEVQGAVAEDRVWSYLYATAYRDDTARRLRESLPAQDGLQTFLWLFPPERVEASRRPVWRFVHALLLQHAARASEARADLQALQRELRAAHAGGPLLDGVNRLLAKP